MPLSMEVGLIPNDFVLDGEPAPSQKGAEPPICGPRVLWPNGCVDQDATWYRGRAWFARHCAPPLKVHSLPIFGQCPFWPKSWMNQDATWYRGKTRPRRRCFRWTHSSALKGAQPPVFGSCLLWPNGWMDE